MKKILTLILISLLSFLSVFPKGNEITISGSTTVFPIVQKASEVFMDKNPSINITVRGGGSGVGISNLMEGKVDIANSSRKIKEKEVYQAKENGINVYETVIANDALSIVVHPSNPVSEINLKTIKDIYTGKIRNWKELGGKDMSIVVISRDVSSGTFEVFNEKVLENAKYREDALLLASNNAVLSTVKDTPGAIGYLGIGFVNESVKALKVEGVYPSKESVNNKTYKISRSLYVYTNGKPKGNIGKFIDFILSDEGQKIVEETGYIPLR